MINQILQLAGIIMRVITAADLRSIARDSIEIGEGDTPPHVM